MVKIGQLSAKLGLLSWWFRLIYAKGNIALGVWVHQSVTYDHHLWSFHKGYLWRLPQHTQHIDLMRKEYMTQMQGISMPV